MKIASVIFLIFISSHCYGQFAKGVTGAGIRGSYSSRIPAWQDDSYYTEFKVLPSFQYWFNKNVSAELGIGYSYRRGEFADINGVYRYHGMPILASLKYWYPVKYLNDRLYFYGQFAPEFTYGRDEADVVYNSTVLPPQISKVYTTEINLSAGLFLFITERFGLDIDVGGFNYSNQELRGDGSKGTNHHNFRINFSPVYWKLGGHYLFNSKAVSVKQN